MKSPVQVPVRVPVRVWTRVALVAALVMGFAMTPVGAMDATVKVDDNFFKPKKLTVVVGDKVIWKWTGAAVHDVSVTKGPKKFHSKKQSSGKYSKVLTAPGTYKIVCTLHVGMTMKLRVDPAPPPSTTPTTPPPPAP